MANNGWLVDYTTYQEKVMRVIQKKRRIILFRTAGFGRRTVAQSMPRKPKKKKLKGDERHGKPPYRIVGTIKNRTNFAVDEKEGTFVIGVLKNDTPSGDPIGKESIPQLLNEGGFESLVKPNGERIRVEYKPHPFMSGSKNDEIIQRAFAANVEKFGLT